jgi:hypothetical protein
MTPTKRTAGEQIVHDELELITLRADNARLREALAAIVADAVPPTSTLATQHYVRSSLLAKARAALADGGTR